MLHLYLNFERGYKFASGLMLLIESEAHPKKKGDAIFFLASPLFIIRITLCAIPVTSRTAVSVAD
jgi:hypothetical protein